MRTIIALCLALGMSVAGFGQTADEHFTKAINLTVQGQTEEAIKEYEKAIELDPKHTDALYNLGAAYYNKGFQTLSGVEANSEGHDLIKRNGENYLDKASIYFEEMVKHKPQDGQTLNTLKSIYVKLEEFEKAAIVKKKLDKLAVEQVEE